ncbi:unnamed protein product [Brassica rapa]|uniref:Uncharacterized protein n=2 Tax=Brassica TaxID=3705 RepID=A0A3P5ZZ75_BRACM|nr:unnamed protein product [Brassica napus]CAG7890622.1 unnamed protein product [Brassica rapa]CDY41300.1 BnaA01g32190D [Brassica napus]VDC77791.1 unnamed protein product [Brassica rapa]
MMTTKRSIMMSSDGQKLLIWDQYHWSGAAITTKGQLSREPVKEVKAELRRVTNQALSVVTS